MGDVIGVDLGGTKVFGLRLREGELSTEAVTCTAKAKTPRDRGADGVMAAIGDLIERLGGPFGVDMIGIGAPGIIDPKTGVLFYAPNVVGFKDYPLVDNVSRLAGGLPVAAGNDVNVAVYGEHQMGAARGFDDVVGVWVGTGVGGGLISGGQMVEGGHGGAAELGHTTIYPGGELCGCGGLGHLEAYASRSGIERRARERVAKGRPSKLIELADAKGRMTAKVVGKAVAAGDEVTMELLDDAVEALGYGVANAVALVDATLVVIGGGVGEVMGQAWADKIGEAVCSNLTMGAPNPEFKVTALGDLGGGLGAAALAANRFACTMAEAE